MWAEKSCEHCKATIRYRKDWNKIPNLCKPCKEKDQAMWAEKFCKNCSATIRYRKDWNKIPDFCPSCAEKERAKWKEKRCKNCASTFHYNVDWENISDICPNCQKERKRKIGAMVLRAYFYEEKARDRAKRQLIHDQNVEPNRQRRIMDDNDFCKVTVRAGWSKDYGCPTTDCFVFIKGDRNGKYHIVYDEYGKELVCEYHANS